MTFTSLSLRSIDVKQGLSTCESLKDLIYLSHKRWVYEDSQGHWFDILVNTFNSNRVKTKLKCADFSLNSH